MSVQVKIRRDTAANVAGFTGAQGELIVDTTTNRLRVEDGTTLGGWPALGMSPATIVEGSSGSGVKNGSTIQFGCVEDTIACSGASSVSTAQIPSRAIVLAVSAFVITAITGATSFNVDAMIASGGGTGTTSGQFGASLGIFKGSSNAGVIGPTAWYASSAIKLTANGSNFTGGTVRVAIQFIVCNPPTS